MMTLITREEVKRMRKEVNESDPLIGPPPGREYWSVKRIVETLEAAYANGFGTDPGGDLCNHKFVHFDTLYKKTTVGGGNPFLPHYSIRKRIDRFFCERCLELKDVIKEQISEYPPDWWKEK
jgi:hypothetical protein